MEEVNIQKLLTSQAININTSTSRSTLLLKQFVWRFKPRMMWWEASGLDTLLFIHSIPICSKAVRMLPVLINDLSLSTRSCLISKMELGSYFSDSWLYTYTCWDWFVVILEKIADLFCHSFIQFIKFYIVPPHLFQCQDCRVSVIIFTCNKNCIPSKVINMSTCKQTGLHSKKKKSSTILNFMFYKDQKYFKLLKVFAENLKGYIKNEMQNSIKCI